MSDSPKIVRARDLLARRGSDDLPDPSSLSGGARAKAQGAHDAYFAALLEGAFLVAAADGELSKEEVGSLADLIAKMTGELVSPGELSDMVAEFSRSLETEGRAGRIAAMASSVTDPARRREVLGFASLVALSDKELAPSELFVLHSIGKGFGFAAADVNDVVRGLKAKLGLDGGAGA